MNQIPRLMEARLAIWTVYDRPADHPESYVARRSFVGPPWPAMGERKLVSSDLDAIRCQLRGLGLHCMPSSPEDAPHIIEVWL